MGFFSFVGRLLFASFFILSAFQMFNEFDDDGGSAAKELIPKLAAVNRLLSFKLGIQIPKFDPRYVVAISIFEKGFGGLLFVFGSPFGAILLLLNLLLMSPLLYDFYNYDKDEPEYFVLRNELLQSCALCGALLFFIGMKNLISKKQLKKKVPKTKVG